LFAVLVGYQQQVIASKPVTVKPKVEPGALNRYLNWVASIQAFKQFVSVLILGVDT
jgi:hypothetical protein